jgi:hypothetical protein
MTRSRNAHTALAALVTAALAAITAVAALPGCAAGDEKGSGAAGGQGGSAAAGGGTTGGGGSISCDGDADCPTSNDTCRRAACVDGVCDSVAANEFGSCDDGLFCTENDVCQEGVCVGGNAHFCPSPDACHIGVCDEEHHECDSVPGNDGANCDDEDPCTGFGVCSEGSCSKGSPIDCSVLDGQCTKGVCDPVLGCQTESDNEGGSCDDAQFCTKGETCHAGKCEGGTAVQCAPPGGCFVATCNEAADACVPVPGNDGAACDDGSPCTGNTTCSSGSCLGGSPTNDGTACDDKVACTTGETCSAGSCGGGSGPLTWLSEDFSDNALGWVVGTEWQIGPATASTGSSIGDDPDTDHTATADDGVAGVVLGGAPTASVHGYYYLESPAFDTSAAPGQVILGFYRWLNSDAHPNMHNSVDVFNGSTWINLWTSGIGWVQDAPPWGIGWTYVTFDLTNYKNPNMRVRWGFEVGSNAVAAGGSWNIDDVLVAASPCP